MATLWWAWSQYESENIRGVMTVLGNTLEKNGYQDVVVSPQTATNPGQDVHAFKPGIDFFAGILFLYTGGQNFWQVVAVGGDGTEAQAQAEIANIQSIIAGIKFL